MTLLDRDALERSLDFRLGPKSLLVTFHPLTLEEAGSEGQMAALLQALDTLADTNLVITLPNADAGGRGLIRMVESFVASHPNARAYSSLGQQRYLSCVAQVDGVVGNSSSGLLEVPSFKKGTVNIGDRQLGRLKASSVIDCEPDCESIRQAIARLYSDPFRPVLESTKNPYGSGRASEQVVQCLERVDLTGMLKKRFYDVAMPNERI